MAAHLVLIDGLGHDPAVGIHQVGGPFILGLAMGRGFRFQPRDFLLAEVDFHRDISLGGFLPTCQPKNGAVRLSRVGVVVVSGKHQEFDLHVIHDWEELARIERGEEDHASRRF